MVEASGCQSGDRVQEICSGTCELAQAFARQGLHTVAVDLARKILLLGRNKPSYPYLEFLETDALALPLADKSFDAVVISLALHHMPEEIQIKVLSEMARLARYQVITLGWHTPDTSLRQILKCLFIWVMDI